VAAFSNFHADKPGAYKKLKPGGGVSKNGKNFSASQPKGVPVRKTKYPTHYTVNIGEKLRFLNISGSTF
jgi:hypothetical protein